MLGNAVASTYTLNDSYALMPPALQVFF